MTGGPYQGRTFPRIQNSPGRAGLYHRPVHERLGVIPHGKVVFHPDFLAARLFHARLAGDAPDRAELAHPGSLVVRRAENMNRLLLGNEHNEIPRTNPDTLPAPGAGVGIDHRHPVNNPNGAKGTDPLAGTQAQTTETAGFFPSPDQFRGPAFLNPVVREAAGSLG